MNRKGNGSIFAEYANMHLFCCQVKGIERGKKLNKTE
ncbi:hypothetical protein YBT020_13820 [Bacillus thuringiensis serovar finitimus YBT-020]|nr:hypothetical protein YBT020_13820 [Bacillus thuringiensis serovar finitimus YBT-020]